MAKYRCPTLGDCDYANSGEIFERAPGEELKCPGCNMMLEEIMPNGGNRSGKVGQVRSKVVLIAGGLVAASVLVAVISWFACRRTSSHNEPADQVSASAAAPAIAPATPPRTSASPGITPNDADTDAKKKQSETDLMNGKPANAELSGNQAAANELIKLAVSQLAQNKLSQAEKNLEAACERDPMQSVAYYDMAIVRLRQNRIDEALKELEVCFMKGFNRFDRLDKDPDFNALRGNQKFKDLLARFRPVGQ